MVPEPSITTTTTGPEAAPVTYGQALSAYGSEATERRPRGERRDLAQRQHLLKRVESEYREMPSLRLSEVQAARLFGLRCDVCRRVLLECANSGWLQRTDAGLFRLAGPAP